MVLPFLVKQLLDHEHEQEAWSVLPHQLLPLGMPEGGLHFRKQSIIN